MSKTARKSRPLEWHVKTGLGVLAIGVIAAVDLPQTVDELVEAVHKGDVILSVAAKSGLSFNVSQLNEYDKLIFKNAARASPEKPVIVDVLTNAGNNACQIKMTMQQVYDLTKIWAPKPSSLLVPRRDEKIDVARSLCDRSDVVPGSLKPAVLGNKPYSVVSTNAVVMKQRSIEPKFAGVTKA